MGSAGYRASRYNRWIREAGSPELLFNSLRASLIRVPPAVRADLEELLSIGDRRLSPFQRRLLDLLIEGGFLVPHDRDEIREVQERFFAESGNTSLSLTLLPTLRCNLACTYCYQQRRPLSMNRQVCDAVVREVRRRFASEPMEELDVDWYGGEPLLALDSLKDLSGRLIAVADDAGASYSASMATNGTLLRPSVVDQLVSWRVEQVQVTLDGLPATHNAHRPFPDHRPSFQAVLQGIRTAAAAVPVRLRINVDRQSLIPPERLLDFLEQHGLFQAHVRVRPYVAMIAPFSPRCAHTCAGLLPPDAFFEYVLAFQEGLAKRRDDWQADEILEYPKPLTRACGAQSDRSLCVDPEGRVYKCGLEVDDPALAGAMIWEDYRHHPNYRKWVDQNPFQRPLCRACAHLPLCLGGCPKYNFSDSPLAREACTYWERYAPRVLSQLAALQQRPQPVPKPAPDGPNGPCG